MMQYFVETISAVVFLAIFVEVVKKFFFKEK